MILTLLRQRMMDQITQMPYWKAAGIRIDAACVRMSPYDEGWDAFWKVELKRQEREYMRDKMALVKKHMDKIRRITNVHQSETRY